MGLLGDLIKIIVFPKPEVVPSQEGWSTLQVEKIKSRTPVGGSIVANIIQSVHLRSTYG